MWYRHSQSVLQIPLLDETTSAYGRIPEYSGEGKMANTKGGPRKRKNGTSKPRFRPDVINGPSSLRNFVDKCAKRLLDRRKVHVIEYSCALKRWNSKVLLKANAEYFQGLGNHANVYALFLRTSKTKRWVLRYVGQRKSQHIRERLIQHLIKYRPKTGSKFKYVKEAVLKKSKVGVRVIQVDPESLRLFVEEKIIEQNQDTLSWNQHGVSRKHDRRKKP